MTIEFREDIFQGEENHPQCPFFEEFPSSPDPYENYYGNIFCHMFCDSDITEICKGDYLECPIAYGRNKQNVKLTKNTQNKIKLLLKDCQ